MADLESLRGAYGNSMSLAFNNEAEGSLRPPAGDYDRKDINSVMSANGHRTELAT